MSDAGLKITLEIKSRIRKFDVGVDPENGEPFEIVNKTVVVEGEQARQILEQMGGAPDASNDRG